MPFDDAFMRSVNTRLRSFAYPAAYGSAPHRRAFVSEFGFRLYVEHAEERIDLDEEGEALHPSAARLAREVREYLQRFGGAQVANDEPWDLPEALGLARRLRSYFRTHEATMPLVMRPRFMGAGMIDDCEGDIIAGTMLYEVKNVGRKFRLTDVRQLLSYCALNYASGEHAIESVGLLNAHAGLFYRISLNTLAMATAGVPAAELLAEIVDYIGRERPSQ